MSLDEDLKKAFEQHARDAQPDGESWTTVERKIRRAHTQRVALISTLTIAVIVAAAVFVPRIGTRPESRGFTNPTVTPTTQTSATTSESPEASPTVTAALPTIPDGWQRRVGVQSAFQLAVPADWKGGWFEGTWDFEPQGLPSASEGGNTFTVSITVQADWMKSNIPIPNGAERTEINGHPARVWRPSSYETDYALDWFFCEGYGQCSSNFEAHTLIARVRADNNEVWSRYARTGEQIVQTLDDYDGAIPVHGTVRPDAGTSNAYRDALIRFLDARVEGIGADELMGTAAAAWYNAHDGLYELKANVAATFEIGPKESGSETFDVTVTYRGGTSRTERITLTRAMPDTPAIVSQVSIS
ncbi:MAG: hypothetical protein ACXVEX_09510 [Actinomycetota bacterium]